MSKGREVIVKIRNWRCFDKVVIEWVDVIDDDYCVECGNEWCYVEISDN